MHKRTMPNSRMCPDIFIPVFVTCSINVGEDLVKLITCSDIQMYLDVGWICGGVAHPSAQL